MTLAKTFIATYKINFWRRNLLALVWIWLLVDGKVAIEHLVSVSGNLFAVGQHHMEASTV